METKFEVNKIEPVVLCGETIGWRLDVDREFRKPFEIEATNGEHDFNKCENCQKNLADLIKRFTEKFDGNETKAGFPYCCANHSNLIKNKHFNRADFINVPKSAANKIIYTRQHIINNINSDDWYKEITDYIEWAILSYGHFPSDCGEGFLLSTYIDETKKFLKEKEEFPLNKRNKITGFIDLFFTRESRAETEFNILLNTYERWIKIFPFELTSYFGDLKPHLLQQWQHILMTEPEINPYSGFTKVRYQTKNSLIKTLITLTESLLTEINGLTLHGNWNVNDARKIKLELIINNRKLKINQGYTSNATKEERQYIRILKEWFEDEKKFLNEITPLLPLNTHQNDQKETDKLDLINIKNNFDSINISKVFSHFFKGLVEKQYLTKEELIEFLDLAFEKKEVPTTLLSFRNTPTKQKVMRVFYEYYKDVAGKPHGKQTQYAALLGDYFNGYTTENVRTNFNKAY